MTAFERRKEAGSCARVVCKPCGSQIVVAQPRGEHGAVVWVNHNLGEARAELLEELGVPARVEWGHGEPSPGDRPTRGSSHFIFGNPDEYVDANLIPLALPAWCESCQAERVVTGRARQELIVAIDYVRKNRKAAKPVRLSPS